MRSLALLLPRTGDWPALTALYLLAAGALLMPWPFGAHPDWAYNWEGYTAWRWATYWEPPTGPTFEIWAPTDGLMTDSGQGPLVGLPVAIGMALAGVGLEAMRVPVALLAAVSVPVLWLLGRRIFGPGPATLAALLLATSPVFLLYGRTATLVGASLPPLLLSALALVRVLDAGTDDGWRWRREGLLAGSLLLGIYAYAPVRLLWPLAIGLLALAAIRNRARRGVLLRTALLCALVVPAATMALEALTAPEPDPLAAAMSYFHARGEQLVAMSGDPAAASEYLRTSDAVENGWDAAARLVGQNAADLARLLLDRDTGPPPVDYWNERGRFWPWFFLPFAVIARHLDRARVARCARSPACHGVAPGALSRSGAAAGADVPGAYWPAAAGASVCAAARRGWSVDRRRVDWRACSPRRGWGARGGALDRAGPGWRAPGAGGGRGAGRTWRRRSLPRGSRSRQPRWRIGTRRRGNGEGRCWSRIRHSAMTSSASTPLPIASTSTASIASSISSKSARHLKTRPMPDQRSSGAGRWEHYRAGEIPHPCQRLWFVAPEIAGEFFTAWHASGCRGAPDSVILP